MDLAATSPDLSLRLFGPLDIRVGGKPIEHLRTRRGYWLLAILALRHGRDVDREWLASTLWPDSSTEQALSSLRRTLTDVRSALGAASERLESPTPHTVRLNLDGADTDVVEF